MWGDRYIPMSYFDSLADARLSLKEKSLKALELQTALLEWLRTTTSQDAYKQFMGVYGYTKVRGDDDNQRDILGEWLHREVRDIAETSSTYYVSGDMCEMVKLAMVELDVSEGLQLTDLPSDKGFLVFDRPLKIDGPAADTDGEDVMISAIMWSQDSIAQVDPAIVGEDQYLPRATGSSPSMTAPGVKYWIFMTPHDAAVVVNQGQKSRMEEQLRAMGLPGPYGFFDGDKKSEMEWVTEGDMRRMQGPLNIYDFSGWTFEQPWAEVAYDTPHEQQGYIDGVFNTHPIVNQVRRILLTTWRMLGQRITNVEHNLLGKRHPFVRRASRVMPCDGDILIIRLRREFNPRMQLEEHGESGEVWWTHRWTSRGHWRRKKGSALDAPKDEWVSPSIKGPAHLPLVTKDKIFSLEQ